MYEHTDRDTDTVGGAEMQFRLAIAMQLSLVPRPRPLARAGRGWARDYMQLSKQVLPPVKKRAHTMYMSAHSTLHALLRF